MAGRIQTNPLGFLNLLGLKTTGRAPAVAPDHVQPGIELLDMYLAPAQQVVSEQQSIANIGDSVAVTVPQTECWFVYGVSVQWEPDVTGPPYGEVAFRLEIGATVGIAMMSVPSEMLIISGGGTTFWNHSTSRWFDRPFIARPGSGFVYACIAPASAAIDVRLSVLAGVVPT